MSASGGDRGHGGTPRGQRHDGMVGAEPSRRGRSFIGRLSDGDIGRVTASLVGHLAEPAIPSLLS